MKAIMRRYARMISVYRDLGAQEVFGRLKHRGYRMFGLDDPRYHQWEAQKKQSDIAFDRENGVQTGGTQDIFGFTIVGSNAKHGLCHIASDPDQFDAAITALNENLSTFSFVDFGSGKGRALFLARKYPFRRIIGIEFARELHQSAEQNLRRVQLGASLDARIELVCADAVDYPIPCGPVVAYMFNPFGAVIIAKLARKLRIECEAQPRELIVCYMNPVHGDCFLNEGWTVSADNGFYKCYTLKRHGDVIS